MILAVRLWAAALPLVIGVAALGIREARGPFWLGSNQDPTYVYLLDSLRMAQGLPVVLAEHPGTTVQVLGAAVLRLTHAGTGSLAAAVLGDPERALLTLGNVLLALTLVALTACGWAAWKGTGRFLACALVQVVPFLSGPVAKHLTDLRPEALLLALSAAFLYVVLRGLGRESGASPIALGVVCGLALATKATALPLVLAGLLALPRGGRLRFLLSAVLTAVAALVPVLPRLAGTVRFLVQSLAGPGVYGSGLLAGTYGPTLRALAPLLALALIAVLGTLALALRPSRDAREAALRRTLLAFGAAQGASLLLLLLQPHGGSRYLLPTFVLFGGNILLAAEAGGRRGWAAGTWRPGLALAAAAGLGLASVVALGAQLARASAEQRGAAVAAASVLECALVRYHKASAPEAALVLGQLSPGVEPDLVAEAERRYPGATFLGYFDESGARWSPVPVGDTRRARFMGFRGPLDWDPRGRCAAFQGSTSGPGRVFETGGFRRESIPLPGPLEARYSSPTESVYVVAPAAPLP
jgi:hypothetical protein